MSEEKIEVPEQNYGPGNVLRAKREEYEWSIEAVAEALHLSTHSVKAIEGDRYDELPGATYVIGYWRSYARLLGIDIEETIEVNKRNLNIVTSDSAGLDVNRAMAHKSKSGGLGWLLFLLLVAVAGYYAWSNDFWGLLNGNQVRTDIAVPGGEGAMEPEAAIPPPPAQSQVLMPIEQADSPEAGETAPEGGDEQTQQGLVIQGASPTGQPAGEPAPPATNPQSALVMNAGSPGSESMTSSPNLLGAQTGTQAQPGTAVTAATETAVPVEPAPAAASEPTGSAGQPQAIANDPSTMVLSLSKDSWLDIRDKTNTRLVYKTESAGQSLTVTGTPPFYVYIGTPDGVSIQYLGKAVPFETHKSGLFARFKLGEEILEPL